MNTDIYRSKFKAAYIDTLLEKLNSGAGLKTINGESILGSGNIDADKVYISDFTVNELDAMIADPMLSIAADIQGMYEAMSAHKVVLVPYDNNEGYEGYGVATGYKEDLLYVTITLDNGRYIDLEVNHNGTVILGQQVRQRVWDDKQDALVSGTNIKTINGQSILGSGNISISGGNGGGSSAYSEVNHGTSDTTFTLTPNTFHVWDEVSALTLALGSETSGVANEYLFQFTSGAAATSLTLPDDIKWANDSAPTIAENMIYQVSILKGLASVLEFSNAPALIENKVTVSISGTKHLVSLQYAAASDIVVKVRTVDGPISVSILSGEISKTASPMGPMVDSGAYIESITPAADTTYKYVW